MMTAKTVRPVFKSDDVRAYNNKHGCGVHRAHQELKRQLLIWDIKAAASIEDLQTCLLTMMEVR